MAEQRKLATIMGIDVAGYSHAAEVDDRAAAEAVARVRVALDEVIAPNAGRVFSTAGDGFMVEFPAAASGVAAARALLAIVSERALPRIRIGLHLGDVIVEPNGDLLGHGVNVAARLMQMAEPNTAVVSQAVQTQLRQTADVVFKPLGRVQLDKMSERVEVFALGPPGARFGRVRWRRWRPLVFALGAVAVIVLLALLAWPSLAPHPLTRPRLAVLRFENLGDTQPYFAEGVADEFISEASRIEGLDVIARASSFTLSGAHATPADAANRLGATLVLTGSVRRSGGALRVHAALVEAPSGRQIWDQTFERPLGEVDQLQRDIAVQVARASGVRALDVPPQHVDPDAYDLYLRGVEASSASASDHSVVARDLFRAATLQDANFAKAWAGFAREETLVIQRSNFDAQTSVALTPQMMAPATEAANRATALDPLLTSPYSTRAYILALLGEWRQAEAATQASEAHGGDSPGFYDWTGRTREALSRWRHRAMLNPLDPFYATAVAWNCLDARDWACAEEAARRGFALNPDDDIAVEALFMAQFDSGDIVGARRTFNEHQGAWRLHLAELPIYSRRYFASLLGDAPHEEPATLLAKLSRHEVHLDDVIVILAQSGYTPEAAMLMTRWGPADRQYLPELYSPGMENLQHAPEFWAAMQREGLVQYWRESGHWPDFCDHEPLCAQYLRR
jgi:TolB-like protein/class 3 adenylate cyclase